MIVLWQLLTPKPPAGVHCQSGNEALCPGKTGRTGLQRVRYSQRLML